MDTTDALDLSKENIQPLKQGRKAVQLGTALQAQTNQELQQKLAAEREYELKFDYFSFQNSLSYSIDKYEN